MGGARRRRGTGAPWALSDLLWPPMRSFPGRMVGMSGKRPLMKVKLRPQAVWRHLNRLHISQRALARLIGVTAGYLSLLMCGKRCPSPATRQRLQEALGVTCFDDLFIEEVVREE